MVTFMGLLLKISTSISGSSPPGFFLLMLMHKAIGTITGFTHGVGLSTGSIMSLSNSFLILSDTLPLKLNGVRLKVWAAGLTLGSMYRVTLLDFNFLTPPKTLGYWDFMFTLLRAAKSIPMFSVVQASKLCLFSSGAPFPWITIISARVTPWQALTTHVIFPFTNKDLSEANACNLGALFQKHYIFWVFSFSHVSPLTMLLVALETTNMSNIDLLELLGS